MKKIVLIACCSRKLSTKSEVINMYISQLFKKSYAYAKTLNPDHIFILSAKYGLLKLDDIIEPYNETLNNKQRKEKQAWSYIVLEELKKYSDLTKDKFIFLAGNNYREYLIKNMNNYEVPMLGLGIGKQLKYLKEKTQIN